MAENDGILFSKARTPEIPGFVICRGRLLDAVTQSEEDE